MTTKKSCLAVLQSKGSIELLTELSFVPKRYNHLKKALADQISSKTLDTRLSELKEQDLIAKTWLTNNPVKSYEYSLTAKGKVVLANFHALQNLPENLDLNILQVFKNFTTDFDRQMQFVTHFSWDTIWPQLQQILTSCEYIETLSPQKKRNYIQEVSPEGILVNTDKGTRTIPLSSVKTAWEHLIIDKELRRDDHTKASYRSSFICGLFSKLSCVSIKSLRPIIIELS